MIFDDYEDCISTVHARYAVTREAIQGRDRTRRTAYARAMVAILMRERGYSLNPIGDVMGRQHTSVMRMCRHNKNRVHDELQMFMTTEQIAAAEALAAEEAANAAAEREAEAAEFDAIAAKVIVMRPELKQYDRTCLWTRRWMQAIARAAKAEEPKRVWYEEMKLLFPLTAETPSALYCGA